MSRRPDDATASPHARAGAPGRPAQTRCARSPAGRSATSHALPAGDGPAVWGQAPLSGPRAGLDSRGHGRAVFRKVLVANRGEIAIRVFRALRELGIGSVAVYSEADRGSLHVRRADEARLIGPGRPPRATSTSSGSSPRRGERRRGDPSGLRVPGRERALRARLCRRPGSSGSARRPRRSRRWAPRSARAQRMAAAGVPIVPGTTEESATRRAWSSSATSTAGRSPIKASAGGGGRGMEVVASAAEAERALETAQRQGEAHFADAAVYVEKYVEDPRHVEIQVLADGHGPRSTSASATARCSAATRRSSRSRLRRPSPPSCARGWARWPSSAARAVGYVGAGTVECLLDRARRFFFLEMNTRIQVEHPVTELVTGFDLVRAQIEIAAGAELADRPGRRRATRATRSSAASTPRTRAPASGRRRGVWCATPSRPGRACASTPASRRATRSSASTTR